ncbi:hypothetical protein EDC01DRAFT_672493 [Geopyxis carbonaria]|nr:hypothetical protein EDC01DRAFT_672493 [Geopyxis carbonaria]
MFHATEMSATLIANHDMRWLTSFFLICSLTALLSSTNQSLRSQFRDSEGRVTNATSSQDPQAVGRGSGSGSGFVVVLHVAHSVLHWNRANGIT